MTIFRKLVPSIFMFMCCTIKIYIVRYSRYRPSYKTNNSKSKRIELKPGLLQMCRGRIST